MYCPIIEKELMNWQERGDKNFVVVKTHDVMSDFILGMSIYKFQNATEVSKVLKTLGDDKKDKIQKTITNNDKQQEFLLRLEKFNELFIFEGKEIDKEVVMDIIDKIVI